MSKLIDLGYLYVPNIISKTEALSIKYKNLCLLMQKYGNFDGQYDQDRGRVMYCYAPPACAFIMPKVHKILENLIGEELLPTYWFSTTYFNGSFMKCHKDRPSCEISLTMNIFGDAAWPIKLKDKSGCVQSTVTPPGHGVAYLGTDVEHWRSPLRTRDGDKFMQLFLHFVRRNGPYSNYAFDGKGPNYLMLRDVYPRQNSIFSY